MNKREIINELAQEAVVNEQAFNGLYNTIEPQFKSIVDGYIIKNNLVGFNFDTSDYISAIGQALWECLPNFDVKKGDFMPRLVLFARKRMKEITDYNLASRRFDKKKQLISYEQLFESEEFNLESKEYEVSDTARLISNFIKTDREGKVIEILISTTDSKLRNKALTALYGQYTATERKRVQRVRERLQAHLILNGVSL